MFAKSLSLITKKQQSSKHPCIHQASIQATQLVRAIITEILFDINQAGQATYVVQQDTFLPAQLILVNIENLCVICTEGMIF